MGVPSRDADGGARPTAGVRRRRRSLQGRRQARVRAGEEAGAGADREEARVLAALAPSFYELAPFFSLIYLHAIIL